MDSTMSTPLSTAPPSPAPHVTPDSITHTVTRLSHFHGTALPSLLTGMHDDAISFYAQLLAHEIHEHSALWYRTHDGLPPSYRIALVVTAHATLPTRGKSSDEIKWAQISAALFRHLYGVANQEHVEGIQRAMTLPLEGLEDEGPKMVSHAAIVMLCELYSLADDSDGDLWFEELAKVGIALCKWTAREGKWEERALDFIQYIEFTLAVVTVDKQRKEERALLTELSERLRLLAQIKLEGAEEHAERIQQFVEGMRAVCNWKDEAEMNEIAAEMEGLGM